MANLDNGLWKLKHTAADKIRAVEALAKMHGWNAAEWTNLGGERKKGVMLNVTYTIEPEPQEENPT